MSTYFISDIHLHAGSTENSKLLLEFLQSSGPDADAIYILGDLFAIWLGDDIQEPYSNELFATLHALTTKNVPIYFMRGNRDFLVGNKFCQLTGAKLLHDPCIINLYNESVLLTHGDQLCTADQNYQKFRFFVQHPLIKYFFLALPKFLRKKLGTFVKNKAQAKAINDSQQDLYDVPQSSAELWFKKFRVNKMIHGHTHRPAVHKNEINTRIVLGDWTERSAKILIWDADGYELRDLVPQRKVS